MIVAHRGASRDAPENTIPAFKLAWEQGADAIEGDFRLTKDGHIVCMHDKDTGRVSEESLPIAASTLEELRRLDVSKGHGEHFSGTGIPTLSEVLAIVPNSKKIYIEIKSDAAMLPGLFDSIRASGLNKSQITMICFNKDVIRALKKKDPQYRALWLCSLKRDESGQVAPSAESARATLTDMGANGFSSNTEAASEDYIKQILDAGHEYHVWTVNDVETAGRFLNWGVGSITTDVPGFLRRGLAEKRES